MNLKIKVALFSTISLTIGMFPAQAMDQVDSAIASINGATFVQDTERETRPSRRRAKLTNEQKEEIAARKKEFLGKNSHNASKKPEDTSFVKSYDVDSKEFQDIVHFYTQRRDCEEFGKLVEFFASVPQMHKQEAIDHLESKISRQNKGTLAGLQYTSEGTVTGTPLKIKGAIPLRQKLLEPFDKPEAIQLETTDDDFSSANRVSGNKGL